MWGSLGSRHCGQRTSAGAVVFHCARRDLVLLRDILRLGTATSTLLTYLRRRPAGLLSLRHRLPQPRPSGVNGTLMPVFRARLGEQRPALGAQTGAVLAAQWRERQREHQGITEHRLEIEQVSVQSVPVLVRIPGALLITEQLLAADLDRLRHWFQAPGALTSDRCHRRHGGEHALGHRLQRDVQPQV